MGWAGLARHSHPVASPDGTVGFWSVNTGSTALHHLAARAGNCIGLACLGGLAGRGSSRSTGLLVVTLALAGGLSDCLGILLVLVDSPVEDVVVLETLTDEEIAEDLSEVAVVGLVVESERTGVVQVDGELVGEATAKDLGRRGHLLLHDAVIFLLLSSSLQTLPRERATAEVQHHVAQRFHVITARLLYRPC